MSLRIASIRMKRRPLLAAMAMAPFAGALAPVPIARAQTLLVVTMVTDTAGIGDQAETTTDCNLRATFSAGSAKVGLVKKGSRVQILDQYRNWRRVRILRRAGIPDGPQSEDEGWIDGTNLRAVETDQI